MKRLLPILALSAALLDAAPTSHRHLHDGIVGQSYSHTLDLATPLSISSGALPTGLSLNTATGEVSGTATESGSFTLKVTDANSDERALHLVTVSGGFDSSAPRYDGAGPYQTNSYTLDLTVTTPGRFGEDDTNTLVVSHPATLENGTTLPSESFPVIILMHGNSYQGIQYQELMTRIASWGYIVLAPTRTSNGVSAQTVTNGTLPAFPQGAWDWLQGESTDSNSRFHNRPDFDSLMLIGHSWGSTTVAWMTLSEQLPAKALVLMDGLGMILYAEEFNNDNGIFAEAVAYPEIPTLVLHGHASGFDDHSVEYTGAFAGPTVIVGSANATHTNYRDPAHKAESDDELVSIATQNLSTHIITAFAERYLKLDPTPIGSLYGPGAAGLVETLGQTGSSWSAYRPGHAAGSIIDDFSDDELATPNVGGTLSVTGATQVEVGRPQRARGILYDSFITYTASLLDQPPYSCLAIWGTAGTPISIDWNLSTAPQSMSPNDALVWEWAQGDENFNYEPEQSPSVSVTLSDNLGASATVHETALFTGPWTGTDRRAVMISAQRFTDIDLNQITGIKIVISSETVDMQLEIDRLRIERGWLISGNRTTPTIDSLPTASAIELGQNLSDADLTGGAGSVLGNFEFSNPETTASAVGVNSQNLTFAPLDLWNYGTATGQVSVTTLNLDPTPGVYDSQDFDQWVATAPQGVNIDETKTAFNESANGYVTNGLIYALDIRSLDPSDIESRLPTPQISEDSGSKYLELELRRRMGGSGNILGSGGYEADGVRYIVEHSSTLQSDSWQSGTDSLELVGNSVGNIDGTETVRIRVTQPVDSNSEGTEFLRYRVEQVIE